MSIRTTTFVLTLALAALLATESAAVQETITVSVAPFELSVSNVQTNPRGSLLQVTFDAAGTSSVVCITFPCPYGALEGVDVEVQASVRLLIRPTRPGADGSTKMPSIVGYPDLWDWRKIRLTSTSFPFDFSAISRSRGEAQCSGTECDAILPITGAHHDGILVLLFELQRAPTGLAIAVTGYESPMPFSFDVPAPVLFPNLENVSGDR